MEQVDAVEQADGGHPGDRQYACPLHHPMGKTPIPTKAKQGCCA
jgi:hypothetical protein